MTDVIKIKYKFKVKSKTVSILDTVQPILSTSVPNFGTKIWYDILNIKSVMKAKD